MFTDEELAGCLVWIVDLLRHTNYVVHFKKQKQNCLLFDFIITYNHSCCSFSLDYSNICLGFQGVHKRVNVSFYRAF